MRDKERDEVDQMLLSLKAEWQIETPPALAEEIIQLLSPSEEEQQRELFGLVARGFAVVLIGSSALSIAAIVASQPLKDWMVALFWGGLGL